MADDARTQKYFDALLESYDILAKALEQANERGIKVSKQLMADASKRQREAIELARKVAAEPTNYAASYSAVMEATVAAQSQALEVTQVAYKEAVAAGAEAREVFEALMQASRNAAEAAMELSREWTAANPFADLFQKGMEAFGATAKNGSAKPKAGASA